MLTAIHRVHLKNGPWVTGNGYEYNLVLIAAVLELTESGPGPVSVDRALGSERSGTGWALAAAAAGLAGAAGAHFAAEAAGTEAEEPTPEMPAEGTESTTVEAAAAGIA